MVFYVLPCVYAVTEPHTKSGKVLGFPNEAKIQKQNRRGSILFTALIEAQMKTEPLLS